MTERPDQPKSVPSAGTAPRWMKIVLPVSLACNLAVLGFLGGTVLHAFGDRRPPEVRDIGFGPFTEALTPQDRDELRRAFLRDGGGPRAMRRLMRTELGALLPVLRSNPLQEDALRAAFVRFAEHGGERLDLGQRLLAERIIAMSPDERDRFADRLEELMARNDRRGDPRPPAE